MALQVGPSECSVGSVALCRRPIIEESRSKKTLGDANMPWARRWGNLYHGSYLLSRATIDAASAARIVEDEAQRIAPGSAGAGIHAALVFPRCRRVQATRGAWVRVGAFRRASTHALWLSSRVTVISSLQLNVETACQMFSQSTCKY